MSLPDSCLLRAFDVIVRAIVGEPVKVPGLRFFGRYRYRVVIEKPILLLTAPPTYDLQPVDATLGLPDLPDVPAWPSLAGSSHALTLSSLVIVDFLDGNPGSPIISAYELPSGEGHRPRFTRIDVAGVGAGSFTDPVVLVGDPANTSKRAALDGDAVDGPWLLNIAGTLTEVAPLTPGAVHITGTIVGTALKLFAEKQ